MIAGIVVDPPRYQSGRGFAAWRRIDQVVRGNGGYLGSHAPTGKTESAAAELFGGKTLLWGALGDGDGQMLHAETDAEHDGRRDESGRGDDDPHFLPSRQH